MVRKLRVLIADDQPLMLAAVRSTLDSEQDIEVVGEATSASQVVPLVAHTSPDLVLLGLSEQDTLVCLERIRARHAGVKVVILSAVDDPAAIARALEGGVCAYVLKSIGAGDLAPIVRQAAFGAVFFSMSNLAIAGARAEETGAGLSAREVEILKAVSQGLSNQAIAKSLWLSDQTVKFHLHNVYRKLGVKNRTEAARYAFDHGLASPKTA